MPIIEGYDELEVGGFSDWKPAKYDAKITGAVLASGTSKDGSDYYALDVTVERNDGGGSRGIRIFYPATTAEWQALSEGRRKATKSQLAGIGLHMSEIESETAREALLGKDIIVEVKVNGEYTNYYFQDASRQDGATLPEPSTAFAGGSAPTTHVPGASTAVVV